MSLRRVFLVSMAAALAVGVVPVTAALADRSESLGPPTGVIVAAGTAAIEGPRLNADQRARAARILEMTSSMTAFSSSCEDP